ncbi:prolactin-releasing peptide [Sphaerodactylus townsendi]|uniref:prolactin-releasing peptide n=1 Tax=Sphaerodactylus townsendi TaxID=933632 RepID=UPI002026A650|nr:prolactin-releasing peptide [Sphaerodactylus townsendi]XP_048356476.1 prolactin-releasing peptide [Sphaerodactylus townsendi]XP_048356487.1 prolactin-releasing peptide [Sphaerodactylus townsendi]
MKLPAACVLCLLLLCLVLPNAGSRIFERSMEIRNPDIDPSWYTGRGIRPVGRYGRRRAAADSLQKWSYRHRQACFPIEKSNDSVPDE